jgi:hypothetical protein
LILFYLVFQVNYMSLAENWRKMERARTTLSWRTIAARLRSCAQTNVRQPALGERSPKPAIVRTRGQQTRQARGQLVFGNFKAPR